jgi:hypothetical protein
MSKSGAPSQAMHQAGPQGHPGNVGATLRRTSATPAAANAGWPAHRAVGDNRRRPPGEQRLAVIPASGCIQPHSDTVLLRWAAHGVPVFAHAETAGLF